MIYNLHFYPPPLIFMQSVSFSYKEDKGKVFWAVVYLLNYHNWIYKSWVSSSSCKCLDFGWMSWEGVEGVDWVGWGWGVGVTFEEEGTCTEHFQILRVVEFKLICWSTDLKQHQNSARLVGKDRDRGLRYGLIIMRDLGLAEDAVVEKSAHLWVQFANICTHWCILAVHGSSS